MNQEEQYSKVSILGLIHGLALMCAGCLIGLLLSRNETHGSLFVAAVTICLLLGLALVFRRDDVANLSPQTADHYRNRIVFIGFLSLVATLGLSAWFTLSPPHLLATPEANGGQSFSSVFSHFFPVASTAATLFLTYVVFRENQKAIARSEARQEADQKFQLQLDLQRRYEDLLASSFTARTRQEGEAYVWKFFVFQEHQFHCCVDGRLDKNIYLDFCLTRRLRCAELFGFSFLSNRMRVKNSRSAWMSVRETFLSIARDKEFVTVFDIVYGTPNGKYIESLQGARVSDKDFADKVKSSNGASDEWEKSRKEILKLIQKARKQDASTQS